MGKPRRPGDPAGERVARMRAAVVGATGYAGAELLRLLLVHPRVEVSCVSGLSRAGRPVSEALPSLRGIFDLPVTPFDPDAIAADADVAFCALPHGASAPIVAALRRRGLSVLDLSADFRLADRAAYEQWYGAHAAPELLGEAVYGLVELHREQLSGAGLVAVPGCYATASILALAPLLGARLVEPEGLVIDAKSGVSGAGRQPSAATHLPEAAEGIRAYKAAGTHRHTPEIEQELGLVAGAPVRVTFTPHLVPMSRGILVTAYALARRDCTAEGCAEAARELYADSPSLVVLEPGSCPDTTWVRGSNRAHVSYALDPRTRRVVAQAAIDNLGKGAAGQALQCLNVCSGWPEGEGLQSAPVWP